MIKGLILALLLGSAMTLLADPYQGMVDKAIAQAEKMDIKISVSIIDQHGNLKAFRRMDGAHLASIKLSQGKAWTAAATNTSTATLAEANVKTPGMPYGDIPEFVLLKGGLPILSSDGSPLGAIGVSGATGDQDEECAKAALK